MKFTAQQIAQFVGGTVDGNPDAQVSNISKIDQGEPDTLSFLANKAYTHCIYETPASVVLVANDFQPEKKVFPTLVRVDDPYMAFTKILIMVQQMMQKNKTGIAKTAVVPENTVFSDKSTVWIADYVVFGENVHIGKNVKIYPHSYIGDNSSIDDDTIVFSSVQVYPQTQIGKSCIIHAGVIIGSDGFGFAPDGKGDYIKIPQLGNVVIHDFVELGANCTIDRATMGSTIIGKGTKLDNLIQVAHNCEIGKSTVIAAQAGFSGSSKVGDNCMIGGQSGVSGHLKIGNKVIIAAQSGISGDVEDRSVLMGSPAFDASKYKRVFVHYKNLDQIHKRLIVLEKLIKK